MAFFSFEIHAFLNSDFFDWSRSEVSDNLPSYLCDQIAGGDDGNSNSGSIGSGRQRMLRSGAPPQTVMSP